MDGAAQWASVMRPASTVIAAALVATACGGTTGSHAAPPLGTAFTQRVTSVCRHVLAEKKSESPFPYRKFNPTAPDVSKLPPIGRYEARGVQIFQSWLQQMDALGQPPTGTAAWTSLRGALQAHARIIADQEAAAMRSDAKQFTKDYFAGNQAQQQMAKAANAAGVAICASAAAA